MSSFRFRAQAALDLRRRELARAQLDLARAEQVRDTARRGVAEASAALADAQHESGERCRAARSADELQWYRFWILRLEHERRTAGSILAARDGEVAAASAACLRAKQRCESLERLREKCRLAHSLAEADAERKVIDELAARRFSARRLASEGART